MHTDTAILTGRAHLDKAQVCQDYALSGVTATTAWAVVCDGCSSGGKTDLGSRWLAHAAAQLLRRPDAEALLENQALFETKLLEQPLPEGWDLQLSDLLATLVVAHVSAEHVHLCGFGDGCALLKLADGNFLGITVSYAFNAPRYLAYALSETAVAQWKEFVGNTTRTLRWEDYDANGMLVDRTDETHTASRTNGWYIKIARNNTSLDMVLIATDGMTSSANAEDNLFKELATIKSCTGQFVQRRLTSIARQWKKQGDPGVMDDLAVAGIWLKPEEDNHG